MFDPNQALLASSLLGQIYRITIAGLNHPGYWQRYDLARKRSLALLLLTYGMARLLPDVVEEQPLEALLDPAS